MPPPFFPAPFFAAAFLVFSLSVTDYGIPLAVGGKVKTLASVMYSSVVGQLDFGRGCVIGLLLLIPALCSSVFELLAPRRWALLLCALTALLFVLAFKGTALYGTGWILILADVLHFFTTPYNLLYQSLQKLSSELESVGSTLGIPPLRLIFDVLLPQCAGTLADMAAYFFVSSTVTISAAAFLSTASTRPLALLVVQYSDQLNLSGAAYLSFLILAVNLLARAAAALVRRLVRR